MKNLLFTISVCLFSMSVVAQQDFRYGYLFKKSKLQDGGKWFLVGDTSKTILDTIGGFKFSSDSILITKKVKIQKQTRTSKLMATESLKGIITERNQDTLFIKFWDITGKNDSWKGNAKYINSTDNGEDYMYVIDSTGWKSRKRGGRYFDLPFRFQQFTATSLPFRVLTKTGTLESDFLNANVAYLLFGGRTRIYKSEFVNPRNRYWGGGIYAGLSSIDNTETSKKEFGLNYGANIVFAFQNLNLIAAYGFQNGFKTATKEIQPYIGFGIGFKLVETFTPEIKNKEE